MLVCLYEVVVDCCGDCIFDVVVNFGLMCSWVIGVDLVFGVFGDGVEVGL